MKKLFALLLLFLFIFGGYRVYTKYFADNSANLVTRSTIQIGETRYTVEVVDSDDKRALGLSGRESLLPEHGMLFLFDVKDTYAFWMKDMKFPIDIVWIDENIIADIYENVPVPLANVNLPRYQAHKPVNKVLEVNAGEVKNHGFKIGDVVQITLLNSAKKR